MGGAAGTHMRLEVVDSVNDPGKPGRSGDDRFGHDTAAGTAWVLDGATDVSDLRPFPRAESGAAWIAEAASARLLDPPQPGEAPRAYWRRVLDDVRARAARESDIPLDDLPGEARPIAAGVWMHLDAQAGRLDLAWLGDCMALVDDGAGQVQTVGTPERAEEETATARRLLELSQAERMDALRAARRKQNMPGGTAIGLAPNAADQMTCREITLRPGAEILLMSDGLYRLISPYATHTPESLFALIRDDELLAAIRALRAMEGADADKAALGRLKTRDDACGLWLRVT